MLEDNAPPPPERRQFPLNERFINEVLDSTRETKALVAHMDKALAVNIQRQEMFYQRMEHLEKQQEKADEDNRKWRESFAKKQKEYEDKQQSIANKINGLAWAWAFTIAILTGIGAIINWGAGIWVRLFGV